MKNKLKYLLLILLFFSTGCDKANYQPQNETLTDPTSLTAIIEKAQELNYKGFLFIDIRASSDFYNGRIRYFKTNIYFGNTNSESAKEKIATLASAYKKYHYIIIIGYSDDDKSTIASDYLISLGYTNVKNLAFGFENARDYFIDQLDSGECGC